MDVKRLKELALEIETLGQEPLGSKRCVRTMS
jgi:hypothetical protein